MFLCIISRLLDRCLVRFFKVKRILCVPNNPMLLPSASISHPRSRTPPTPFPIFSQSINRYVHLYIVIKHCPDVYSDQVQMADSKKETPKRKSSTTEAQRSAARSPETQDTAPGPRSTNEGFLTLYHCMRHNGGGAVSLLHASIFIYIHYSHEVILV